MTDPNPNATTAGDLFNEADLVGGGATVLVEPGEYQLVLSARYNEVGGGIVFAEGTIAVGPDTGKNVKVFTLKFKDKQKSVGMSHVAALGLGLAEMNALAKQVGASTDNLEPLYKALAEMLNGISINAQLVLNTFKGKNGEQTEMQVALANGSKMVALTPLNPVGTVAGLPTAAAPAPAPAPAPAAAAPVAPVAAPVVPEVPAAPVEPAPVQAAPVAEAVPAPAPAPVAPEAAVPAPAPAPVAPEAEAAAAPAAPVAPVAPATPAVEAPDPGF